MISGNKITPSTPTLKYKFPAVKKGGAVSSHLLDFSADGFVTWAGRTHVIPLRDHSKVERYKPLATDFVSNFSTPCI